MLLQKNFSLKNHNTFGIEAHCALFAEISTVDELKELIHTASLKATPKLILGGGSNVLFTRDFEGLVIKNSIKGITAIKEDNEHIWVKAAAGEVWHELVLFCIRNNYAGIENLSLIPGLTGAAPMQNIGAYGVELESVFENLEAVDIHTGELITFSKRDCRFGYRESVFKNTYKGRFVIVSVTLRLNKKPHFNISYGSLRETLDKMGVQELTIKAVSDAVIAIRTSKLPDPKHLGNAGSFFKNPEITPALFETIKKDFPEVPSFQASGNKVKIPAAWLIEQCGWKGKRIGNTGSHQHQALVLVNYGNATGKEIYDLALAIQQSVREKFGIEIVPEVNII
ncbi:MAG: UDP-N-acetylenolpyruvoylglucosamine reductase [Chitinophagales bacterium]|nr:MAG: UDP-N-acetylenolpyruvoylglucosamine reductase [Chitinophagales bacterium]